MAKKTRTELSTSAINTNLPDNTQELITPTTERAQLTDERESVVNYKDDLGGTSNAGKFLTVATDGESLTMVDAPTGDVTGSGVAGQVTIWDDTNNITSKAMLVLDDTFKVLKIIIPSENASGGISIDQQGTTGSGSLVFLDDGVYKAQIVYDVSDGNLTLNSNGDIEITPDGDTVISGGTPIVEHVRILSGGNVGIGTDTPSALLEIQTVSTSGTADFQIFSRGESPNYEVFKISRAAGSTELLANQNLTLSADYDANHTSVDSNIIFKTDNTERMRITSGGDVILGPYNATPASTYNKFYYMKSAPYFWDCGNTYNPNYEIAAIAMGAPGPGQDDGEILFQTAQNVCSNNAASVLTTRARIIETGEFEAFYGIKFPNQSAGSGTVASSTLDAYEEGTFTPTNNGDATGGLGATIGEYTRVGNVVHFRLACTINSNFTGNGVGGLPYTIGGATSPSSVVGTIVVMQGSVNYMFGLMGATTSRIEFFSDNKFSSLPPTTAMGTLRMSGSYRI